MTYPEKKKRRSRGTGARLFPGGMLPAYSFISGTPAFQALPAFSPVR